MPAQPIDLNSLDAQTLLAKVGMQAVQIEKLIAAINERDTLIASLEAKTTEDTAIA